MRRGVYIRKWENGHAGRRRLSSNSTMPTFTWRPRQVRDVPFSPNSITLTFLKLGRGSFGKVSVMEFGLKGTSRVCRGLVADVTGKSAWWNLGLTGRKSSSAEERSTARGVWRKWSSHTVDVQRVSRRYTCSIYAGSWRYTAWVKKNPPWNFLAFFPKRLEIFSPNFTRLLRVPFYAGLQIIIQLSATLTKLCHIKRDHHNVLKMSTIDRNACWVVALNMAT